MKSSTSRRAGRIADRKVQYALVARVMNHWIFFTLASSVFLLVSYALFGREPGQTVGEFFSGYAREVFPLLLVSVFLMPIFMVDINKVSHRFAGPMTRLRRGMKEVGQGESVPKMGFRPGDFWHELATDFNAAVDKLDRTDESAKDSDANVESTQGETVTVGE